MPDELGSLLRQWRRARQISMEITAQRAGITLVTLHRWETGQFWPRLPELEAVLRVLETTPRQQRQALTLLAAPRALVRLRQEVAQQTGTNRIDATGAGGLLRALRLRRHLTLEAVAHRMGIYKSTLARWERGETWPSSERLHTLGYVLEASGEELAALTCGQGGQFLTEDTLTVEAVRIELQRVCMLAPHEPEEALKDLLFLRLEAQVWPRSTQPEYALLLAEVRAAYASYLAGVKRYKEASSWSDRALERIRPNSGSIWWMYAALAQASSEVFRAKRPAPKRGLGVLRAWLPEMRCPDFEAWALRDMAEYALLAGEVDAALHWSAQSCRVVEAEGLPKEVFVRQCDHAVLLLQAGLPQQALTAMPAAISSTCEDSDSVAHYPNHRVRMALLCVKAFHSLGEVNTAHDWLQRAYATLGSGYLSPRLQTNLRGRADRLAQQF